MQCFYGRGRLKGNANRVPEELLGEPFGPGIHGLQNWSVRLMGTFGIKKRALNLPVGVLKLTVDAQLAPDGKCAAQKGATKTDQRYRGTLVVNNNFQNPLITVKEMVVAEHSGLDQPLPGSSSLCCGDNSRPVLITSWFQEE